MCEKCKMMKKRLKQYKDYLELWKAAHKDAMKRLAQFEGDYYREEV